MAIFLEYAEALATEDRTKDKLTIPELISFKKPGGGGNKGDKGGDVVYYIAGALLVAAKNRSRKLSASGHTEMSAAFATMAATNSFTPPATSGAVDSFIKATGVPIRLALKRKGAMGQFANPQFYRFVWNMERCYGELLTTTNLVAHKSSLVQDVLDLIVESTSMRALFKQTVAGVKKCRSLSSVSEETTFSATEEELWRFFTGYYYRLRGKDKCCQMLTKIRVASKAVTIRQTVAARATSNAKRGSKADSKEPAIEARDDGEEPTRGGGGAAGGEGVRDDGDEGAGSGDEVIFTDEIVAILDGEIESLEALEVV
jgi:hypothetical protein